MVTASSPTASGPAGTARRYVSGLDGLRALAVALVILYHLEAPWLPGGFLGVDVFFVISGYLITSQLWVRWGDGELGFARFWLGRARRLLPVLGVVLLATAVAQMTWGRGQLRSFVGDLAAAATYTSNWWYVLHQRSYFEAFGRPPALQHLWSLAVEEQFYLLWPLVVAAMIRSSRRRIFRQRRLLVLCIALAFLSALVMGIGTALSGAPLRADPSRFYFGTDAHATGLLAGATLAMLRDGRGFRRDGAPLPPATPRVTAIGAGALAAVVVICVVATAWSPWLYRVGFALLAVLCAVLIAAATRPGPLARILDWAPLRAVGQRSYGLYLWHWPVIVFTRPGVDVPLGPLPDLVLRLALIAGLNELGYRLVELPTRREGVRRWWRGLARYSAGPVTLTRALSAVAALVVGATLIGAALTPEPVATTPAHEPEGTSTATAPASPSSSVSPSEPPRTATPEPHQARTQVLAVFGDSVALGAERGLAEQFAEVHEDAGVGEQAYVVLDQLTQAAPSLEADVVLLHTGNNGVIDKAQLLRAVAAVPENKAVLLVLPRVPRAWQQPNLTTLRAAAAEQPRIRVVDWYGASEGHPEFFEADGVHLAPAGVRAYADLVRAAAEA